MCISGVRRALYFVMFSQFVSPADVERNRYTSIVSDSDIVCPAPPFSMVEPLFITTGIAQLSLLLALRAVVLT